MFRPKFVWHVLNGCFMALVSVSMVLYGLSDAPWHQCGIASLVVDCPWLVTWPQWMTNGHSGCGGVSLGVFMILRMWHAISR